jgi:hypothetical protein
MNRLRVLVEVQAAPHEVAAVEAAFRDAGFDADVRAPSGRRGRAASGRRERVVYPWVVYVTVPMGLFLRKFLELAAEDAWAALKRLVKRVHEARDESRTFPGDVRIRDERSNETIILLGNEPDEAFQQLAKLEVTRTASGYLVWDGKVGRWVDAWAHSDRK